MHNENANCMNTRPGFTLAQRLSIICGTLIAAMAALAVTVWVQMTAQALHADEVALHRIPQLQRIADIELNVTRASLQVRHAMLARNSDELNATLADISAKKQLLDTTLDAFGKAMVTPAGRDAFKPMPALMQDFWTVGADNLKLIQAGKKDEAFAFLVETTIPARNRLLAPLAAEKKRQGERMKDDVEAVRDEAKFARSLVLSVVVPR